MTAVRSKPGKWVLWNYAMIDYQCSDLKAIRYHSLYSILSQTDL